jgi:hypothetical protein
MKTTEVMFALSAIADYGSATECALPNPTLQHNDHVRHGSCLRTLRASHDRG